MKRKLLLLSIVSIGAFLSCDKTEQEGFSTLSNTNWVSFQTANTEKADIIEHFEIVTTKTIGNILEFSVDKITRSNTIQLDSTYKDTVYTTDPTSNDTTEIITRTANTKTTTVGTTLGTYTYSSPNANITSASETALTIITNFIAIRIKFIGKDKPVYDTIKSTDERQLTVPHSTSPITGTINGNNLVLGDNTEDTFEYKSYLE